MTFKKRYVALIVFAAFAAYNGVKGWNDTAGQHKAFNTKTMQATPGAAEYDDMVATRIDTLEAAKREDKSFELETLELCVDQNPNMSKLTCSDYYEVRVSAEAMSAMDVSLPQVVLSESLADMKANKEYSAEEYQAWVGLYSHIAALLKIKDGSEMLVKNGIMTADESEAIRSFLNVQYTDILKPDFTAAPAATPAPAAQASNDEPTTPGAGEEVDPPSKAGVDANGYVTYDEDQGLKHMTCDKFISSHGVRTHKGKAEVVDSESSFTVVGTLNSYGAVINPNGGWLNDNIDNILVDVSAGPAGTVSESRVNGVPVDGEKHDMIYSRRINANGSYEFFITDKTAHTETILTNCR